MKWNQLVYTIQISKNCLHFNMIIIKSFAYVNFVPHFKKKREYFTWKYLFSLKKNHEEKIFLKKKNFPCSVNDEKLHKFSSKIKSKKKRKVYTCYSFYQSKNTTCICKLSSILIKASFLEALCIFLFW